MKDQYLSKCSFWRRYTSRSTRINSDFQNSISPIVAIEWIAPHFHIQKVPGSHLDPEIGYPDWRPSWFSTVHPKQMQQ
jgi:hypothetical protein